MRRQIASTVPFAISALLSACQLPMTSSGGVELRREEVAIQFANQRSAVTSWQADGRDGIWVEGGKGEWYYARFFSPCIGIETAVQIGFDTGTSDQLDRYSYVIVPNQRERCAIASFTRSDPPPEGDRREYKAN